MLLHKVRIQSFLHTATSEIKFIHAFIDTLNIMVNTFSTALVMIDGCFVNYYSSQQHILLVACQMKKVFNRTNSAFLLLSICFHLQKATAIPARKAEYFDSSEPVQNRVYKSLKVWSMLADLEESLGTFQVNYFSAIRLVTIIIMSQNVSSKTFHRSDK